MSHTLSFPHLSKADLRSLAHSAGPWHRQAIDTAKHLLSLPHQGMISEANRALSELEREKLTPHDDVLAIRSLLKLLESVPAGERLRKEVEAIARPVLASKESSPIAIMVCSIAVDSVEHEPASAVPSAPNKNVPRDKEIAPIAADVAGALAGAYFGGRAGPGAGIFFGLLGAGVASAAVAAATW